MKIKPGIRPWQPKYVRPSFMPPINMIIEMKDEMIFSDNALLYQGILEYGIKYDNGDGFLFTDMGNWLIETLPEFVNYYSGSKAKTRKSSRLENRRERIQNHLSHLFTMELVRIKRMVPARKNKREIEQLYELTTEGQFLAWVVSAIDPEKATDLNGVKINKLAVGEVLESTNSTIDKKRSDAITKVFETVIRYTNKKESFTLKFLSTFFDKYFHKGVFSEIIDIFYYYDLKYIEVNRARELLRLFTKMNHPLNWIFFQPNIFVEAINEMDNETRRALMFNFKMEIEEYHNKYYLAACVRKFGLTNYNPFEFDSSEISMAGKEWQVLRVNNLGNERIVIVPGRCSNCKSDSSTKMDITKYLDQLHAYSSGTENFVEYDIFKSDCEKCKQAGTVFGMIYLPFELSRSHEKFSF
jgi:hypothetical protein